ncbi:MAG: glycosyltransferase family 2 protein, partial [Betaproteobacteria bacterium]|nr:glycosyltransferase family 2 protein [Betaproteobacteria bacterium]
PWPPRDAAGKPIEPEFSLEVVRDPTGCNTHPQYGLTSAKPMVSVYRRPRPAANLKYPTHQNFGVSSFIGKNGLPTARDPDTGKPTSMNLMADARAPSLRAQAADATATHMQRSAPLSREQLDALVAFESQVYIAQQTDRQAGSLVEADGPPAFGPRALQRGEAGVLGNNTARWVFPMDGKWHNLPRDAAGNPSNRDAARESIARGHDVFMFRTFWIRDSMHLNSVGLGNPVKRTCATCHGMHMTGMDTANGWMDIGTTNLPWAREAPLNPLTTEKPELPLFKLTCRNDVAPHPGCLPRLLAAAQEESAAVCGPLVVGWGQPPRLLERGIRLTGSGRRVLGVDPGEVDQGQHDDEPATAVLAVSSTAMLVRLDVWDALNGYDPAFPMSGDDIDFCRRAHRAGFDVLVVPSAKVRHAQALTRNRRPESRSTRPVRDLRLAALHLHLAHATR